MSSVASRVFRSGQVLASDVSREQLERFFDDPTVTVLIDFVAPTRDDLAWVAKRLRLHPVAITDALEAHTRPKLDRYESHDFLFCYYLDFDEKQNELHTYDIGLFFAGNAVVAVRSSGKDRFPHLFQHMEHHGELSVHGVYALLFGVLDAIVDSHFDAVQVMDERLDDLEDRVFGSAAYGRSVDEIQHDLFAARKTLVTMRRLTLPMREIVNAVIRDEQSKIPEALLPYFADVYDHTLRVDDWVDSSRDLVTSLLDANLTIQGNRMNLIMKKVTSWAAIIAVPTLITGFFGQNVAFFGYGDARGLALSGLLMAGSIGVLYWLFRRNDWL